MRARPQQHLNLLGAELRAQRRPFDLGRACRALGLLAGLLLLAGLGLRLGQQQTEAGLQRAHAALDAQRRSLLAAPAPSDPALAARQAALQAELERLRQLDATEARIAQLLASGQAGQRGGHSELLRALARQADPAVGVTLLRVGGEDAALELRARMADAAALPDYLRRLQAEPVFQGRPYAQLSLQRVEADAQGNSLGSAYTEFVLRTRGSGSEGGSPASGNGNDSGVRP